MFIQHRYIEGSGVDFCIENQLPQLCLLGRRRRQPRRSSPSRFPSFSLYYFRIVYSLCLSLSLSLSLSVSVSVSVSRSIFLSKLQSTCFYYPVPDIRLSVSLRLVFRASEFNTPGCKRELNTPANARRVIYAKMKTLRHVCIRLTGLTVAPVLMILSGGRSPRKRRRRRRSSSRGSDADEFENSRR